MPPRLTAHQMFIAGVILTGIGATLALVTDGWVALLFESADFTPAVADTIATLLREIALASVSGLGYNAATSPVYFGVGCGKSGAKNVSWGNVFGYQKLKAYATGLLTAGMIAWH